MSTNRSLQTILCPVDFSPCSDNVLTHIAERYARHAELIVLHVANPDTGNREELFKEHLHRFSRYSGMLSAYGCKVRFAIEYGSPAEVIIDFAMANHVDLILLGSHGANNISRLLVGSTTERVMRKSPCQVLVLKSPEVRQQATNSIV